MNDRVETSVGQVLREAREARNITLDDVAMRLRLMHRQIEAMENDDFGSLGQPVFARGFVRNYARLMGLEPEPLLARMAGAPAEPTPAVPAEPPMSSSWLTSPWLLLLMLGMLVMVAVPVSLYLWLNSGGVEPPSAVSPSKHATNPATPAAPAEAMPAEVLPEETAAPTDSVAEPAVATEVEGVAAAPVMQAAPEIRGALHLEFGAESWVDIKDSTGRTLHRQLNPAGSVVDVLGQPPFEILVGNAAQTRMTYNGRPFDLKPFTAVTVARFTLEE